MSPVGGFTHGGLVEAAARELGVAADDILDFSANLNPAGLPRCAAERLVRESADLRLLARYPDPEARELRTALSRQLDVGIESIVVAAGADSLIHAAIRCLAPRQCVIPIPAFAEYQRACAASGVPVRRIPLDSASAFEICAEAAVIWNNPHNPTGLGVGRTEMLDRIARARSAGASVIVDEAFIDYTPEAAITRDAGQQSGVIAIRSLTKFYGCASLRVGYAVASPETARELVCQLPPWPVTTLAANALAEAIADDNYARETLANNCRRRAQLNDKLTGLGCRVLPGVANFLLFELPDGVAAEVVRQALLRKWRILVRGCDSFDGLTPGRYLRVAVRGDQDNGRLIDAVTEILHHAS